MSESESTRDGSRWTLDRKSLELDVRRTLDMPSRRLFNRRILTLGGLTML
ncbi:molybdopterin-binding protein, partial [Paraburkholderia sp. SIMBA_049]